MFVLTRVGVEGVSALPKGGAAQITLETAPVEELSLSAPSLQHIEMLLAEITELAAAHIWRQHGRHRLWKRRGFTLGNMYSTSFFTVTILYLKLQFVTSLLKKKCKKSALKLYLPYFYSKQ